MAKLVQVPCVPVLWPYVAFSCTNTSLTYPAAGNLQQAKQRCKIPQELSRDNAALATFFYVLLAQQLDHKSSATILA